MDQNYLRSRIRKAYGTIAKERTSCCSSSCCGGDDSRKYAKSLGYSDQELEIIPTEANLALSCGNPTALATLQPGEVVLDLGSGAGFDCFLAAEKVGLNGRVIGVDMTPEMIEKARSIAEKENIQNVEFRLGEIENLPVADNSVDVVLSNCVINLSANKTRVFQEIYRVLKPGGRAAISDIALVKELPETTRSLVEAYVGCVAGASLIEQYKKMVIDSGLQDVKLTPKDISALASAACCDPMGREVLASLQGRPLEEYVVSIYVEGRKPVS